MAWSVRRIRWPAVLGLALVVGAAWLLLSGGAEEQASYRVAPVDRGAVVRAVAATGTLAPVITVTVGSQVSGRIVELHADFNSDVKAGQVVARLDPSSFQARVAEAQAEVMVVKANVAVQRAAADVLSADIIGIEATLKNAEKELDRNRALFDRRVAAASAVDKAVSARDEQRAKLASTKAKLGQQRAQLVNAEAQVAAREAALRQRSLDLENSIIRSPVDGVVISRDVDVGQTVAASLQSPVLFTIARDLADMQVEVSVDEADIGRVREGQRVDFTVDAYPGRDFAGRVAQVRKAANVVSNVVTYTVVVGARNPDLALLPGMTANVRVIVGERDDVLRVPNQALRFRPAGVAAEAAGGASAAGAGGPGGAGGATRGRLDARLKELSERLTLTPQQQEGVRTAMTESGAALRAARQSGGDPDAMRRAGQQARQQANAAIEAQLNPDQRAIFKAMVAEQAGGQSGGQPTRGRVWVVGPDGAAKPLNVALGLSDANVTEVVSAPLQPGDQVIVGIAAASAGQPARSSSRLRFGF